MNGVMISKQQSFAQHGTHTNIPKQEMIAMPLSPDLRSIDSLFRKGVRSDLKSDCI